MTLLSGTQRARLARYHADGETAFQPRSRRPKTSPAAISDDTVELITTLRKELAAHSGGMSTIWAADSLCAGVQASVPKRESSLPKSRPSSARTRAE